MTVEQHRWFLKGFVLARVSQSMAIDKDRAVNDIASELSNVYPKPENAVTAVKAAIQQLQEDGFIEVNDANNIIQDDPVGSLKEVAEQNSSNSGGDS